MRRARVWCVVVSGVLIASAVGCKSGQQASSPGAQAVKDGGQAGEAGVSAAWAKGVAERVAQRRDRPWKSAPKIVAVEAQELEPTTSRLPAQAANERALVLGVLFGTEEPGFEARPSARERLANFDAGSGEVTFAAGAPREQVGPALAAALCEALLAQHFGAPAPTTSWDAWLAQRAIFDGEATIAALLEELDVSAETVASRPDLVDRAKVTREWVIGSAGALDALDAFSHRAGFAMATSMHRSLGWSGPEMLLGGAPGSTAGVLRHGEWMAGQGAASWTWPAEVDQQMQKDGFSPAAASSVGAAALTALLRASSSEAVALTAPSSLRADAFRTYTRGEGRVMLWATMWETPFAAAQARELLEHALDVRRRGGARVRTWRDGLTVSVAIAQGLGETSLAPGERVLAARASFPARDGFPVAYKRSAAEAVHGPRDHASYDDETHQWKDPGLGMKMDLSGLADFKVDLNSKGPLRWYARKGETLVQLTAELVDPLGPDFETSEYASKIEGAFASAMLGAKTEVAREATSVGDAIVVALSRGESVMRVWHVERDDVVVTFSVSASGPKANDALVLARDVLSSLSGATGGGAKPATEPVDQFIEYTVE